MTGDLKNYVAEEARALGFDVVGFAAPDAIPEAAGRLRDFLSAGRHGDMDWLAAHETRRKDPRHLWTQVQSIIMLGMNYAPDHDPMDNLTRIACGNISVYARGVDYHNVMKKKLKTLARRLLAQAEAAEGAADVKVFVDTAPVMEKPLAAAAGLGWQGKHTNLVSRDWGSWLFLGCIFTTLKLPPDEAEADHCGSCRACLDICPTDAFVKPYQLDARKCISYLTIEAKEQIPRRFRRAMGNRIYGCDDCLAVCPWNKYASAAAEVRFHARNGLDAPPLEKLVQLDEAGFRALFAGSPIKRTGRDRFVRNVLVALGNMGADAKSDKKKIATLIEARLDDASPLVRGMAVWAWAHFVEKDIVQKRAQAALQTEKNKSVREEWEACL